MSGGLRASLAVMVAGTLLASCATTPAPSLSAQDAFFLRLSALCGRAFQGQVVSDDPADADMAGQRLVMHVRDCSRDTIRIPFHVGEDRSRTWVLTRFPDGLRLKHDHRHEDGTPDAVTMYGGDTAALGSATRQEFPVDRESIDNFIANGLGQSVTNIWAVEAGERVFAYELRREGVDLRFFRIEFDLSRPIAPPPPPWGDGALPAE